MGYQTVTNVPRVMNYRHAKQVFDTSKPIRGRSPEIRPLGNRRDADTYWVRMDGEDVQFMLYKTPVITYKPDGSVVLLTNGYDTVSTHQFFQQVLGVIAGRSKGASVVTLKQSGGVASYKFYGQDKLTLRMGVDGWYCAEGATPQFKLSLNRRATTNVRNRYKEFITYFKGMVNLRTEEFQMRYWNSGVVKGIRVSIPELQDAFDQPSVVNPVNIIGDFHDLTRAQHIDRYHSQITVEQYTAAVDKFIKNIRSDQPEDNKHMNFYRMALVLLTIHERIYPQRDETGTFVVPPNTLPKFLDTLLLRAHAHEVLMKTELPLGEVSSNTYENWVRET